MPSSSGHPVDGWDGGGGSGGRGDVGMEEGEEKRGAEGMGSGKIGMEGGRDGRVTSFIWDSPWKHSSFNFLRSITSDEKRSRNSCSLQRIRLH